MHLHALVIAATGLLATADDLQGTWTVTSFERGGKKEQEATAPVEVVFKDGLYTLPTEIGFTKSRQGQYKLDPSRSPKAIDLIPSDGPNKGLTIPGIYWLEGETLIACYGEAGKGRPTEFASRAGSGWVLVTYRRAKP